MDPIAQSLDGTLAVGRGAGIGEFLGTRIETSGELLFALATQLGDVWFLFLLGCVVYVAGESLPGIDRRRGLFVLALVLAYVAVIEVLKPVIGVPRPSGAGEPLHVQGLPPLLELALADITTADGHGFPSGHAFGSTVVWGGLALVLDRSTLPRRMGVAAGVVTVVSASRLVLGVHYLVDVVAGVGLGALALGALYPLADRGTEPGRVLAVAVGAGIVALLVTVSFDSVAAVGGAIGGWLSWRFVAERTPARPTSRRASIVGFGLLAVTGVVFGALYALAPPHAMTFVGTALAVGVAVIAPVAGERVAGD